MSIESGSMRAKRGPIAARIAALLRRRQVRIACFLTCAAGLLSPFLPLANVPGYESAAAATLLALLLGGVAGIAAARQERSLEQVASRSDRPSTDDSADACEGGRDDEAGLEAAPNSFAAATSAGLAAFAVACLPIASVLVGALIAGAFGASCSLTRGLGWYPILPLPTAFLASMVGLCCGAATSRRRLPGLLFAAVVLASAFATAWPVLTGPQVFLYDHLLGYLPGPLYDEVVEIRSPLLFFRLLSVGWGVGLLGWVALLWDRGSLGRPGLRPVATLLLVVGCGAGILGSLEKTRLGFGQTTETVAKALGGRTEGSFCTVIHPREMKRERLLRFVDECDHRVEELQRFFDVSGEKPTVFLYRNREEKRQLVGASGTQFAKPWLRQLHVDERGWPHPVLKHELAHLVSAPIGRQPFGVTAVAFGLLPVQGLIEGAAVAADWPAGELTVHEQARAMRILGLAPSLPRILSALGFYGQPASRAYTYAGSFVRWLVDSRGPEAFARVYRDGDFLAAYGTPMEDLVSEWELWLDGVPLPDRARAVAERRFKRPAIFRRPCARQVADLADDARAAFASGDYLQAAELYGSCAKLDENDPAHLLSRARAFSAAGRSDEVHSLLDELRSHPARHGLLEAAALVTLGDALAREGKADEAGAAYTEALSLQLDRASERNLVVKSEAVADPDLAEAVFPYLADGGDTRLLAIRDLLERRPAYGAGWYLIGRRLQQRDEPAAAIRHLDRALEAGLPSPLLEREARRTRALAFLALRQSTEACAELERLSHEGEAGERLETLDLLGLCRYQARLTATR